MLKQFKNFYKKSPSKPFNEEDTPDWQNELKRKKWSVFLSITFGYGFYYVCRLSFNVIKKPLVDAGIFDASELGLIGSGLFFAYAFGKLTNGILADRVNVRRFMATGLFISAIANLMLSFTNWFWFFVIIWTINGWFQSFGAPASVVSVSQWTNQNERGSFYGMWGTSHNIGEAITYIGTAIVVSTFGWMWGFRVAGIVCILFSIVIYNYLYERPEVYGLPSPAPTYKKQTKESISAMQWEVFKNPTVWILALSSACFYVTRYAVNSWGIFFLEIEKGYSAVEASSIISISSVVGIAGTFFSGILSDKLFKGKRNAPAFIFGIIYACSVTLFVLGPANAIMDTLSMVFFGLSLGVLIIYLGGLMAVDICSKEVAGTALGIVGVASYLGAAVQDILSGYLIEGNKTIENGKEVYNFDQVGMLWIGASIVSLLLASLVWNVKSNVKQQ